MSTQFIQKKSSTAQIIDLPEHAGCAVVGGDLYIHDGTAARKVADAGDAPVGGVAAGYKVAQGEIALDGSNPTPVATGLTTITGVVLTLKGNVTPGDSTSVLTYDTSGGTLNLYAWKNTGGTDPTLVASTGTETVGWVAFGS